MEQIDSHAVNTIPPRARKRDRAFLFFLMSFYGAWILRVVLLLPMDKRIEAEWIRQCWSQGLRILIWVVPVFVYLAWVDRVRPVAFLKLDVLPRGRRLAMGLGIMAAFLALSTASAFWLQGARLNALKTLTGAQWTTLLVTMSIIAVAEEILFRGFVFQKLRSTRSFGKAGVLSAALFLLIHVPGWLYMQGPHWGLATLALAIFVIGWVLALLTETTHSLWPPIVLHLLNNVWSASLH